MSKLQIVTALALGGYIRRIPYIWGGDNWLTGLDCSGFIGYLLRKVGVEKSDFDTTAQGYHDRYPKVDVPQEGCLVYYGKSKVTHIMYCLDDELCIGMVNGDSTTTSPEKAAARKAYCEIRPIKYRSDVLGYNDPFKR